MRVPFAAVALTISFVVLKLTTAIDWSWWWVLLPLLVPSLSAIAGAAFVAFVSNDEGSLSEV